MTRLVDETSWAEFDEFVQAFEAALAEGGQADLATYLPPEDHPLHDSVLRELVRVDLEYRWERGQPRMLDDYLERYPELARDPQGLREIVFEEFRLRSQAGRHAEISEYRARFGDEIAHALERWQILTGIGAGAPSRAEPAAEVSGSGAERLLADELAGAAFSYREFRRHHDAGDTSALDQWCSSSHGKADADCLRLFHDVHQVDPAAAQRLARGLSSLPDVGEEFLGFRLIAQLGRGAFGRVYLARQGELADRLVALKVSTERFGESRTLARLQHTNIVPIYSVHRAEPFQALCMPYYGSTTLRDVYLDLRAQDRLPESGRSLFDSISRKSQLARGGAEDGSRPSAATPEPEATVHALSGLEPIPAVQPAGSSTSAETLRVLAGYSYVDAVLWMVSRLAAGLAHAHERGILHRDLKPANILLTDDGQPMLLDFNLSEDLKLRITPAASIAGTLPYMAPEQLAAFRGGTRPVDERSDLYSLGIILFELLTGRPPYPVPKGPPDVVIDCLMAARLGPPPNVRTINPAVSPAVGAIVRHLLEPEPDRRYPTARQLAEDLDRHLASLPLKHAPEPSVRERLAKWTRRHPLLCSSTSVGLISLVLICALAAIIVWRTQALRRASARLQHQQFEGLLARCQLLLNTEGGPASHFQDGLALASEALGEYGVDAQADWTTGPQVAALPAAEARTLREEVAELLLLRARAEVALHARAGTDASRLALRQAVAWLDRAERADPSPSSALYDDRARYLSALGRTEQAARDRAKAQQIPLTSARDYYLRGTSALAQGRPDLAEGPLSRAVALGPKRFWAWFVLGICHFDQDRFGDASFDFSVCTTLAPEFAWPHLNRGLALARLGRLAEAKASYDRAIELDPKLSEALIDRALVSLELGLAGEALADLDHAARLTKPSPILLATRAEALARLNRRAEAESAMALAIQADPGAPALFVARGYTRLHADRAGARADFDRALRLDGQNARALLGKAYLARGDDPEAALGLVDQALASDPSLLDAWQLRALLRARRGDTSAEADLAPLLEHPSPRRLYNAACVLALLARSHPDRYQTRALELLGRARDAGMPAGAWTDDPDLVSLKDLPEFRRLFRSQPQEKVAVPQTRQPPSGDVM